MANVIKKTTNKFTKGLVMDFSPENTQNEVLTHALNATLLTFNGNELSLQNDMGNGRVETAYLPEGYMPVGTCEYGGIIYIVSYNPLENKSQIGCFPSPERNISREELGEAITESLDSSYFQDGSGKIKNNSKGEINKKNDLNIISVGRLHAIKGYDQLIDAVYKFKSLPVFLLFKFLISPFTNTPFTVTFVVPLI